LHDHHQQKSMIIHRRQVKTNVHVAAPAEAGPMTELQKDEVQEDDNIDIADKINRDNFGISTTTDGGHYLLDYLRSV